MARRSFCRDLRPFLAAVGLSEPLLRQPLYVWRRTPHGVVSFWHSTAPSEPPPAARARRKIPLLVTPLI